MKKSIIATVLALAASFCLAAVDVNKASEADLDSIKGIGPSTTSKILDERKASPFKNWGDLISRVPGIGEKRAERLSSEGLTVNGEAFKATAGTPTANVKPAAKP